MKEEEETEYLAAGHVLDHKAHQTETGVSAVFMQSKKNANS